jgi:hypothetical protein
MNQRSELEEERIEAKQSSGSCETEAEETAHTVGTFGGEEDRVVRTREGKPVPNDTGDQGGGQN